MIEGGGGIRRSKRKNRGVTRGREKNRTTAAVSLIVVGRQQSERHVHGKLWKWENRCWVSQKRSSPLTWVRKN